MVETHFDESYSSRLKLQSGVWGRRSQPPEANGGSGAEPPTLRRFYSLFSQKYAYLGIFWFKYFTF